MNSDMACAVVGNTAYVVGGIHHGRLSSVFAFDGESKQWREVMTSGVDLPPCSGHSMASANNDIYLFGGLLPPCLAFYFFHFTFVMNQRVSIVFDTSFSLKCLPFRHKSAFCPLFQAKSIKPWSGELFLGMVDSDSTGAPIIPQPLHVFINALY
jgi:hypothetical protein